MNNSGSICIKYSLSFLLSSQLVLFGLNNQLVVAYKEENTMALKNLFLKDYSGVDEDDYCVAVYTQQAVYDSLYYVLDQVSPTCGRFQCCLLCCFSTVGKNPPNLAKFH